MLIKTGNKKSLQFSALFLTAALLSSCSNYPTDYLSCRGYGNTIWEKCWWFNNAGTFSLIISFGVWGLCGVWINNHNKKIKKDRWVLGMFWFLLGIPLAAFSAIFLAQLIENLLQND